VSDSGGALHVLQLLALVASLALLVQPRAHLLVLPRAFERRLVLVSLIERPG